MKAMTAEQKQIINDLLVRVGDLVSEDWMTHILNAIKPEASSNYPHGQIIIKQLNMLLVIKNSKKENIMKATQREKEITIIEDGFNHQTTNNKKEATNMATNANTCPKCSGTGAYNVRLKDGSIGKCFACKGTGTKEPYARAMTEAQVKFIRELFAEAKQFMTQEQIDNLVKAMLAHKSGAHVKSIQWASAAIDKLKAIKATKKS
jgi:hypothetical protein